MNKLLDLAFEKTKRANPDSGELTPEQALRWAAEDILSGEVKPSHALVVLVVPRENGYPDIVVYRGGELSYAQELGYAELYKDQIKREWEERE